MLFEGNEAAICLSLVALYLGATEVGYRLGVRRRARSDESDKSHIGSLQGALLGLLALLLGFSFAMAVGRYDTRRALVIKEANAIGTTYLRTDFLPSEQGAQARKLLSAYVDARLQYVNAKVDRDSLTRAIATSSSLQAQLWSIAANATNQEPRSVATGLFVASLNEVIDVSEERLAAFYAHVPEAVLALLVAVSCGALCFIGYGCGLNGRRRLPSTITFNILTAMVLLIVLDMDRPREGLVRVSQDSMLRLQDSLRNEAP